MAATYIITECEVFLALLTFLGKGQDHQRTAIQFKELRGGVNIGVTANILMQFPNISSHFKIGESSWDPKEPLDPVIRCSASESSPRDPLHIVVHQVPSSYTTSPPVGDPVPQVIRPLLLKHSALGASLVVAEREDLEHKVLAQILPSIASSVSFCLTFLP